MSVYVRTHMCARFLQGAGGSFVFFFNELEELPTWAVALSVQVCPTNGTREVSPLLPAEVEDGTVLPTLEERDWCLQHVSKPRHSGFSYPA